MKKFFSLMSCAALVSLSALSAGSLASAKDAEEQVELRTVQAAVAAIKPIQGEINTKADYYIYLASASHCPPCRALMPKVVKEYSKLKRKKIELILLCGDKTEDAAKEYASSYKAKFPVVMFGTGARLPGYKGGSGIPNATIVDADGKVIDNGHGKIILEWKKTIRKADLEAKKAARAAKKAAKEAAEEAAEAEEKS